MKTSFAAVLAFAFSPFVVAEGDLPNPNRIRRVQSVTPAPTPAPTKTIDVSANFRCFSAETQVQVQGVGHVPMKDLQVGDYILAGTNSYEEVYAFGHNNPTEAAPFYQLHTKSSERPLEMTASHLVFLDGKTSPVRADMVQEGDVLRSETGPAPVTDIKMIYKQGLYTPLTKSGTVVADGIVASSYISLQDGGEYVQLSGDVPTLLSYQTYVHIALSPFRILCNGISSQVCNTYTEEGLPQYVAFGIALNEWGHNQNIVVECLVLLAVLFLTGSCMILETIFSAHFAPTAVLALVSAYAFFSKGPLSFRATKVKTV